MASGSWPVWMAGPGLPVAASTGITPDPVAT
jgi:hypothetical protein